MEERGALLPSFFRSCSSSRADRKCPSYSEEAMEGGREGGTFIGCSVSSVFCSLPPYRPSRLLPVFPDGARVNTSGGRPSASVRQVSVAAGEERKEGREPHCVLPLLPHSHASACHQLTSYSLSLSVSSLRSLFPALRLTLCSQLN